MRYKQFTTETKLLDAEAGIFEAMISTEAVDRDGDVILASGARLENYLRNPVVLWGHNYYDAKAVVGKALDIEVVEGKGLRARFQFAGPDVSEDADLVRRLWQNGFLNATSIGFIPKAWKPRQDDQKSAGYEFTDWELLEFSVVPVPSNQEALRLAMKSLLPAEPSVSQADAPDTAEPELPSELETEDVPDEPHNDAAQIDESEADDELKALAQELLNLSKKLSEVIK